MQAFMSCCKKRTELGGKISGNIHDAIRFFVRNRPSALSELFAELRPTEEDCLKGGLDYHNYAVATRLLEVDDSQFSSAVDVLVKKQACDLANPHVGLTMIEAFAGKEFTMEADSVSHRI